MGKRGFSAGGPQFNTTRWSLVLAATHSDWSQAASALELLCRMYWIPIYTYIRRCGHSFEDAQDLAQEFFARLLQKNYLRAADPEKGRFRSYLLILLKRFMANEWDYRSRLKRGGASEHLSLERVFPDAEEAERSYRFAKEDSLSPSEAFDRRWAVTLLEEVLSNLEKEFVSRREAKLFVALRPYLTGDEDRGTYEEASRKLGMTQGALRIAVHRMRLRYRELLRLEISHTLARPEDIEDEIRFLFAAINR